MNSTPYHEWTRAQSFTSHSLRSRGHPSPTDVRGGTPGVADGVTVCDLVALVADRLCPIGLVLGYLFGVVGGTR